MRDSFETLSRLPVKAALLYFTSKPPPPTHHSVTGFGKATEDSQPPCTGGCSAVADFPARSCATSLQISRTSSALCCCCCLHCQKDRKDLVRRLSVPTSAPRWIAVLCSPPNSKCHVSASTLVNRVVGWKKNERVLGCSRKNRISCCWPRLCNGRAARAVPRRSAKNLVCSSEGKESSAFAAWSFQIYRPKGPEPWEVGKGQAEHEQNPAGP